MYGIFIDFFYFVWIDRLIRFVVVETGYLGVAYLKLPPFWKMEETGLSEGNQGVHRTKICTLLEISAILSGGQTSHVPVVLPHVTTLIKSLFIFIFDNKFYWYTLEGRSMYYFNTIRHGSRNLDIFLFLKLFFCWHPITWKGESRPNF